MALPGVGWPRDDHRWYWIVMQAIWSGDVECLRTIVQRCDPNMRHPRFGRTMLHDVAGGRRPRERRQRSPRKGGGAAGRWRRLLTSGTTCCEALRSAGHAGGAGSSW